MGIRASIMKGFISISVFVAVIFFVALFVFKSLDAPPTSVKRGSSLDSNVTVEAEGSILFVVKPGEAASSVGKRLESAGIIRSALLWTLLARIDSEQIKTGTYRIQGSPSTLAIRDLFVSGKQLLIKVTVPEGFTLKKIAALLDESGIVDAALFLEAAADTELLKTYGIPGKSFEGFLYPDTYLMPRSYPAKQAVRAMADTFFHRIEKIVSKPVTSFTAEELYQKVTLASIIEREYRVEDEAPLMAGVFQNRLKQGMALQSCATVEYVITEIQGKPHPDVLYNKDIAIRDPYNTYVNRGLPPGPISCPGETALDAAFNPASSDYLYFRLIDPSEGRHRFSRTLNEHLKAGVIYLKKVKAGV